MAVNNGYIWVTVNKSYNTVGNIINYTVLLPTEAGLDSWSATLPKKTFFKDICT